MIIRKIKPCVPFLRELDANKTDPHIVDQNSYTWKHKYMYRFARLIKRELHFDGVMWDYYRVRSDDYVGFLLYDQTNTQFERGSIVGGCSFRLRRYSDHPPVWALQWIYILPEARKKGILKQWWSLFTDRFGLFDVESPLSEAMENFMKDKKNLIT